MNETTQVRLRKPNDEEIYGPMSMFELKHLADTAYISPEDEIAFEAGDWMLALECEDLAMIWTIQSEDGTSYGPTTAGTIKEFLTAGEISTNDKLVHAKTGEVKTIRDVLGEEGMQEAQKEMVQAPGTPTDEGLSESMEIAKDLRIRTLECEMEALRKEHDDLKQKYMQSCDELVTLKKSK